MDAVPVGDCESGPAVGITTDRRGLARPGAFTDGCDVGSVELQGSPPSPPTTTTTTTAPLSPNTAPSTTNAPPPMPTAAPSASAELPATLPRTGSPRLPLVVLGGSLLVAIGLALVARRERRAPS